MSRCRTLCAGLLLAVFVLPVAQADARRITFGERDLRQGMRGTDVRVLQDFLTKAGVKTSVDGQFGPRDEEPRSPWERKSKLPINGVVTREDAATLRGQVGRTPPACRTPEARSPSRRRPATPHWGPTGWRSRRLARRPRSRRSSPLRTRSWASRTSTAAATGIGTTLVTTAQALVLRPPWCRPGQPAPELHGVHVLGRGRRGSGSRAMPTAGTPTSWSPAYGSTPVTTAAAPVRSGAPRCARRRRLHASRHPGRLLAPASSTRGHERRGAQPRRLVGAGPR